MWPNHINIYYCHEKQGKMPFIFILILAESPEMFPLGEGEE